MTGTILHNTKPINIEGKYTFITYDKYQGIEEYYYESLPGPSYGCPASASEWKLEVGVLPPGLEVELNTGIVKGTIQNVTGGSLLVRMLESHPTPVPLSTVPGAIVTPPTYALTPSIAGPDAKVIVTYNFSIRGYDYVIPPVKVPGTLLPCQISVLKNWHLDVEEWKKWEKQYNVT